MPSHKHSEKHFQGKDLVRDIVIGMSDGLTVPFALAAGLSQALSASHLIVMAGLAEIAAGAVAMGLGGYLAAKGESEHYERELSREKKEVAEIPEAEMQEVRSLFHDYGLSGETIEPVVQSLSQRPNDWVKFMMRFELGIEKPKPERARTSACTIGLSYVIGGLIPLTPYFLNRDIKTALYQSILYTGLALFLFGFAKARFTGMRPLKTALQTLSIGGLAALAAFLLAKVFS